MNKSLKEIVFSKNVIEFVTVSKEFCDFLEKSSDFEIKTFINKTLKILSLLYLKTLLLPETEQIHEEGNEKFVSEFDWQFIKNGIQSLLNEKDYYLDFFDTEMKETPEPVTSSISENLADIYQDLKDFLGIYQIGIDELSNDAIFECIESFNKYWGFKLVNSLRILHNLEFVKMEEVQNPLIKDKVSRDVSNWFISKAQNDFQSNE